MNREQFWELIEAAKTATGGDCQAQAVQLVAALGERSIDGVLAWDRIYGELMAESYGWDLWGAAYLINGGCSDDGFHYFRGWLLGQGRVTRQAALADPDSLADHPEIRDHRPDQESTLYLQCEDILGVAYEAYEALTGQELTVEVAGMRLSWARTGSSTTQPRCECAIPGCGRSASGRRHPRRRLDALPGWDVLTPAPVGPGGIPAG
jgi:Protein of unknown function (DUF4240)